MKCNADDQGRADLPRTIGHLLTELFLLSFSHLRLLANLFMIFRLRCCSAARAASLPHRGSRLKTPSLQVLIPRRDADQPLVEWLRTLRDRVSSRNCHFGSFLPQEYRPAIGIPEGGAGGGYGPADVQLVSRVFKLKRQTSRSPNELKKK